MTPMEIPPGVVSKPTKKMNSSNWAEANLMRWVEGSLTPVGGQEQLNYSAFATRCRKVHSWTSIDGQAHTAYLCEGHCYVDTGGTLTDISPTVPLVQPSDSSAGGYGDDVYGTSTYGTARPNSPDRSKKVPELYSMDNWGSQLVVQTSPDGRLLYWDPAAPSSKLAAVSGAPTGRFFVVTPERFIIMFSINGGFRTFGWCDQENYNDWNFASTTNKAGSYDVEPASPLITALSSKNGIVFFTAKKAYVIRYVGLPYVYQYEEIGDECAPWSPASIAGTTSQIFWISEGGAWTFDGSSIQPIPCPVRDWVNDDVNRASVRLQACATVIGQFSEFWWFFPQSGQQYNTRCIIYNYREGWWSQGRIMRSAGMTSSYTSYPILADGTKAYKHESGINYAGVTEYPWIETYVLNIQSGGKLMTVKQMLPDIDGDSSKISFQLYYKMDRSDKTLESVSPKVKVRTKGYVDFRKTGRDFRLRIEADGPDVPAFTIGQSLFDADQRGMR